MRELIMLPREGQTLIVANLPQVTPASTDLVAAAAWPRRWCFRRRPKIVPDSAQATQK
jgi:hypothetical protein